MTRASGPSRSAPEARAGLRGRARQPARDPARNRASILRAATAEFSRHGLGGARVDAIASRAGVNKRMLYYYYGDKESLFLATLEACYGGIRRAEQRLDLLNMDPAGGVRRLVEFTWKYYLAHPEFISLLNSENLHRARHLRRSREIRAMHSPLVATLGELLRRGREEGVFRAGVDPVQLYISIAAIGYFYLANRYTLSTIFARDLSGANSRRQRIAHMIDLILGYLRR